jgi:hypothetical protein
MAKYQHAEAYCLMTYRADDGEEETIWNSRDGVTPFIVTLKSGKQAMHVDWSTDRRDPNYKPKPGERIFVDLTEERRKELWLKNCQRYWPNAAGVVDYPNEAAAAAARAEFKTPEAMAEYMTQSPMHPGEPDLIEVTE